MVDDQNKTRKQMLLLLELQELDNEIIDFEDERETIPEEKAQLDKRLTENQNNIEDIDLQISTLDEEVNEKERAKNLERLKLKNTRNKETALQNIKQYEAYIKEIETQEQTSDELDDRIKEAKEELEAKKKERDELQAANDALNEEHRSKTKELDDRFSAIDDTLEEMYDRRDELIEKIDEDIYYQYEYIAERKNGVALAEVEHGHCVACNMAIPPQMFNELIRGDKLMTCPACNRLLIYIEKEEAEESQA